MSKTNKPVAVITGGSRGIGRAACIALAQQGWDICFSYIRNQAAAQETSALVEAAGGQAVAVLADMGNRQDISALFAACQQTFGRLDALVNNRGHCGHPALDL